MTTQKKRKKRQPAKKKTGPKPILTGGPLAISMRLGKANYEIIKRAADIDGEPLTTWIRRAALARARNAIVKYGADSGRLPDGYSLDDVQVK